MGVILTAAIAADARVNMVVRAGGAGMGVMMVTGLYLTLSRGAFLCLFVGAIVLIAVFPRRWSLVVTALVVSLPATLAIVRLGHYPVLIDPPKSGLGQASAGTRYGPQLLLLMVAAGLAQAGIVSAQKSRRVARRVRRAVRRFGGYKKPILVALAGLIVICVLGSAALNPFRVGDWTSSTGHYVEREWSGFLNPKPTFQSAGGTGRLITAQGDRLEIWRVAANAFTAHPVAGEGAGSYEARWYRERREDEQIRNAHSLYLETSRRWDWSASSCWRPSWGPFS